LGLLGLGGQALALICTIDDVPAATLLLPYFEVDLANAGGVTTLFSINNASAAPALVHVVVWTDLSIHVLDFNVYLTGYDVFTQNLRDLFVSGTSPLTEHNDDADAISPVGDFSIPTNPITGVGPALNSCDNIYPLPYSEPLLNATYLTHIQNALTGGPSPIIGGCSGVDHGDDIARGYITFDNVNECDIIFPGDFNYFLAGGIGLANNQNQLWGDYFYVYNDQNFAQGETLVHIEASDALGVADYTFYRRFTPNGEDQREGLGSTFAVRYLNGGPFSGGTDLLVWRDGKIDIDPQDNGFTCGTLPAPFPLGQAQIVVFDEHENPDVPEGCQISPCPVGDTIIPFPWEANRSEVGGVDFPVPFNFGWLYLNLNSTVVGSPIDVIHPGIMQNWVTAVMDADGRYSVGFDAIQLDNVTDGTVSISLPVAFE
jgi:hypothetical protein